MVRSTRWMTLLALGLLLAWQTAAAEAQLSSRHGRPIPSRSRNIKPADDAEPDDSIDSNDTTASADADDRTAAEDNTADEDMTADDAPQSETSSKSFRDFAVPRATNAPRSGANSSSDAIDKEVIRERYPDGTVRVEREVAQDDEGNYRNHGGWKTWDAKGNLVAMGEFDHGSRTGTWVRWYRNPADVPLFSRAPYSKFNGPYISQATFSHDQLDGFWAIYDGKKAKISQFEFKNGKRHGTSIWFHASGHKMREAQYRDGDLHGQVLEWGADGTLSLKENYQGGRRLAPKVMSKYQDGGKKSEGMYLFAKEAIQSPDDWWNCRVQTTSKQGRDERHGPWTSWYSNGQVLLEGNFDHDQQNGQFTWWHQNGQKILEGNFDHGKQDGVWTWWYPTGQKSIRGEYVHGHPTGRWTWWKEDGKVSQSADLSRGDNDIVIDSPPSDDLLDIPQAKQPKSRPLNR